MAFSCLFNLTVKVFNIDAVGIMRTIPRPTPFQDASSSIIYLGYKAEVHYVPILPRVEKPQLALELAEQAAAGAGAVEIANSFAVAARQLAPAPRTTPPRASSEFETGTFSAFTPVRLDAPRSRHRQKEGAPPSENMRRQRAPLSRRSSKRAAPGSVSTAPRRALASCTPTLYIAGVSPTSGACAPRPRRASRPIDVTSRSSRRAARARACPTRRPPLPSR